MPMWETLGKMHPSPTWPNPFHSWSLSIATKRPKGPECNAKSGRNTATSVETTSSRKSATMFRPKKFPKIPWRSEKQSIFGTTKMEGELIFDWSFWESCIEKWYNFRFNFPLCFPIWFIITEFHRGKANLAPNFTRFWGGFTCGGVQHPQKPGWNWISKNSWLENPSSKLRKRWKKMLRVIHRLYLMFPTMSSYQRVMVFLMAVSCQKPTGDISP